MFPFIMLPKRARHIDMFFAVFYQCPQNKNHNKFIKSHVQLNRCSGARCSFCININIRLFKIQNEHRAVSNLFGFRVNVKCLLMQLTIIHFHISQALICCVKKSISTYNAYIYIYIYIIQLN